MALILPGKSRCAACGEIIEEGDAACGLPHFTNDPADPQYRFTDAPFHLACFQILPERLALVERINTLDEEHGYPPRFRDIANPS